MQCISHASLCSLVLLNAFLLLRGSPLLSISELPVFPMENSALLKQSPFANFPASGNHPSASCVLMLPDMSFIIVESY